MTTGTWYEEPDHEERLRKVEQQVDLLEELTKASKVSLGIFMQELMQIGKRVEKLEYPPKSEE